MKRRMQMRKRAQMGTNDDLLKVYPGEQTLNPMQSLKMGSEGPWGSC